MASPSAAPNTLQRQRVWSLADLEVLHEVEKPILVIVTAVKDSPDR